RFGLDLTALHPYVGEHAFTDASEAVLQVCVQGVEPLGVRANRLDVEPVLGVGQVRRWLPEGVGLDLGEGALAARDHPGLEGVVHLGERNWCWGRAERTPQPERDVGFGHTDLHA